MTPIDRFKPRSSLSIRGVIAAVAIAIVGSAGTAGDRPLDDALARAADIVREEYRRDYASRDPAVRRHLAKKLVERAERSRRRDVENFFLLEEGSRLFAQSGELDSSLDAAEKLARAFRIDSFDLKWENVRHLANFAGKSGKKEGAIIAYYESLAGEAWMRRGSKDGLNTNAALERVAKRTRNAFLASRVAEWKRRTRSLRSEIDRAHKAWNQLAETPDDPFLAAEIGAFRCFHLDDWKRGLSDLAKSPEPGIKRAAVRDLASPDTPEDQLAVALAWEKEAGRRKDAKASALLARACAWYEKARSGLSAADRNQLDERLGAPPARDLADLAVFDVVVGWGEYCRNGSLHTEGPLTILGYHDTEGVLLHPDESAPSVAKYRLHGAYRRFSGWAGLPDRGEAFAGALSFSIHGDGRELWRSKRVTTAREYQPFAVSVKGVDVLELRVDCHGAEAHAMATWVKSRFSR